MLARSHAYAGRPAGLRAARPHRRGTTAGSALRPAPDTMTMLSGFLPVEQGVACWAALRAHTDTVKNTGDPRTRDQIMADTLVERVTGQAPAGDVQAEVAIVIPVDALTEPDTADTAAQVAEIVGHGPIPAPSPRRSSPGPRGGAGGGGCSPPRTVAVVGGDPTRRCFDGTLAALIAYRDGGRCREPFCDAPARHIDHIVAAPRGRTDHLRQRPRHLRALQPGPGDARLGGPPRARRPRRPAAHRHHGHPHRPHLHQPRRPRPVIQHVSRSAATAPVRARVEVFDEARPGRRPAEEFPGRARWSPRGPWRRSRRSTRSDPSRRRGRPRRRAGRTPARSPRRSPGWDALLGDGVQPGACRCLLQAERRPGGGVGPVHGGPAVRPVAGVAGDALLAGDPGEVAMNPWSPAPCTVGAKRRLTVCTPRSTNSRARFSLPPRGDSGPWNGDGSASVAGLP